MKGAPLVTVTGIRGINRPAECWCVSRTNRVYQGVREVRGVDKPLYAIMCQAMWSVWAKHSRHQKENISDNDRECCYCKNKIYLYLIWEHRSKQTHSKVRLHQFHRVAGFLCHLLLDFTIRRYNSTRIALLSSFFKKTKQKKPHLLVEVSADQVFLASLYASMASSLGHPISTPVETMHI